MKTHSKTALDDEAGALERTLHILHLEDCALDRIMIQQWITAGNIQAAFTNIDNELDFIAAFDTTSFDIILSDNAMPGFDGVAALHYVREKHPDVPFLFVTGSMGEEAAVNTLKDGAADYILKDRLSRLVPAIHRAVRESRQLTKGRVTEQKSRRQAALLDKAQDAIVVVDMNDRIQFWNRSAERIYGWPVDGVTGRKACVLLPFGRAQYEVAKRAVLERGSWKGELISVNGAGDLIVESRWALVSDEEGESKSILIIDTDVTEKKALDATLLRSQRMDCIGALAGGIAHDLNNALAPVLICADLLKASSDTTAHDELLDIIHANARRAASLVSQILGFARGSGKEREPVQFESLIDELVKTIQSTFPKSIHVVSGIRPGTLWTVEGNATELHQVLMNLCVNARDAMPQGGQLTLSADNFMVSAERAHVTDIRAGRYVVISVADTGTGIPPEILRHILKPFFTTKAETKGTGLGLFTVSEIIKRYGGFLEIQTRADTGTEMRVHLPATESPRPHVPKRNEVTMPEGHGELILVIDDEEAIRELTKTSLETYGYRVITAQDGVQGVARFREHAAEIKLLVTDTDMPNLDGMGAVRVIKDLKPNLPVILASGTTRNKDQLAEIEAMHLRNLGKPYSLDQLLNAVDLGLH